MHQRHLTYLIPFARVCRVPALANGMVCAALVLLLLSATPVRAESDFLLSITSLELDRYVTRTPSQTDAQLPVKKRRRGKQPTLRDFIARDLNPNRDFNYLWLRNYAGKKEKFAEHGFFGDTLHAGVRVFRGKRMTGELYYLTDNPDIPRWGDIKYWLGMSTDQVRFRVRYHF